MNSTRTRLDEDGSVIIPADYVKALGLKPGDPLIVRLLDRELRILTLQEALRQAQQLVRQYVPEEESMVDELIAERRAEADHE